MKILLIADLHSNWDALKAVDAAEAPFDLVICAGDLVDWGMDPKPVLDWVRAHSHIAVRGNHEDLLLSAVENHKRQQAGLEKPEGTYSIDPDPFGQESNFMTYTINRLTDEDKEYLRSLPSSVTFDADGYTYCLNHMWQDGKQDVVLDAMCRTNGQTTFDEIWETLAHRPEVPSPKRRIIFAHTHQCWMYMVRGGALYLNPGSISNRTVSRDTVESGADYMVIENGIVQMKHVSYPTQKLRERIQNYGFDQVYVDLALQMIPPEQPSVTESY